MKARGRIAANTPSFLKDQQSGHSTWVTTVHGVHLGWDEDYPFFKANYINVSSVPGELKRVTFFVSGENETKVISFAYSDDACVFFSLGFTIND
jgi:hypothetical protein